MSDPNDLIKNILNNLGSDDSSDNLDDYEIGGLDGSDSSNHDEPDLLGLGPSTQEPNSKGIGDEPQDHLVDLLDLGMRFDQQFPSSQVINAEQHHSLPAKVTDLELLDLCSQSQFSEVAKETVLLEDHPVQVLIEEPAVNEPTPALREKSGNTDTLQNNTSQKEELDEELALHEQVGLKEEPEIDKGVVQEIALRDTPVNGKEMQEVCMVGDTDSLMKIEEGVLNTNDKSSEDIKVTESNLYSQEQVLLHEEKLEIAETPILVQELIDPIVNNQFDYQESKDHQVMYIHPENHNAEEALILNKTDKETDLEVHDKADGIKPDSECVENIKENIVEEIIDCTAITRDCIIEKDVANNIHIELEQVKEEVNIESNESNDTLKENEKIVEDTQPSVAIDVHDDIPKQIDPISDNNKSPIIDRRESSNPDEFLMEKNNCEPTTEQLISQVLENLGSHSSSSSGSPRQSPKKRKVYKFTQVSDDPNLTIPFAESELSALISSTNYTGSAFLSSPNVSAYLVPHENIQTALSRLKASLHEKVNGLGSTQRDIYKSALMINIISEELSHTSSPDLLNIARQRTTNLMRYNEVLDIDITKTKYHLEYMAKVVARLILEDGCC